MNRAKPNAGPGRGVVVAMVLGTAVAAWSATGTATAAAPSEQALQDIQRYCTACWRNARLPNDAWGDCTQEVFTRLLQRVSPDAWGRMMREDGEDRREFLRAIDAVKKRTQRGRKYAGLSDDVADRRGNDNGSLADEREEMHRAAREVLSDRQQRILQMSCEGWEGKESADELAEGPDRVSDEKYKAIRKLRNHLRLTDANSVA